MSIERKSEQGAENLDGVLSAVVGAGIDEGVDARELQPFDAQRPKYDALIAGGKMITPQAAKLLDEKMGYRDVRDGMTMVLLPPDTSGSRAEALAGRKILVPRETSFNGIPGKYLFPAVVSLDSQRLGELKVTTFNMLYGHTNALGQRVRELTSDQRTLLDGAIEAEAPSIGSHSRKGYSATTLKADFEHVFPAAQAVLTPGIGRHAGHGQRASGSVISASGASRKNSLALLPGSDTKVVPATETFVFFYDEGLEHRESGVTPRPLDLSEGALRRVQGMGAAVLGDRLSEIGNKLAA